MLINKPGRKEGVVTYWLAHWTVPFQTLARVIVLCSWAGHFTVIVPLQKPIRVETCNARSQRLNIQFCQVPYLDTRRVCTRTLYTRNGTRNSIFGFSVSYLDSDLNDVNFLQELKKFVKCIQVKFYRLLKDDKTEEFDQNLILFNQACSSVIERELARAKFNPNVAILIGYFFRLIFQIWNLMETNVQTLCTMRIIGSYTFQPLWVSGLSPPRCLMGNGKIMLGGSIDKLFLRANSFLHLKWGGSPQNW